MSNHEAVLHAVYDPDDEPAGESQPLAGVTLSAPGEPGELEHAGDEGAHEATWMRAIVAEQATLARSCEDPWEAAYHRYVALPIGAVLALGIDVARNRRAFGGTVAAALLIFLAVWSGVL